MSESLQESATVEFTQERIVQDYRVAYRSRQASLLGRREVFAGRAKFGVFGDGKEIAQLAMDMDHSGPIKIDNIKAELSAPDALYNTATKFHFECAYASGVKMIVADTSDCSTETTEIVSSIVLATNTFCLSRSSSKAVGRRPTATRSK